MPRRRHGNVISRAPVLVGAVTVLVTIVAVFLAYNAHRGLPFVPTYQVTVQLPDAANLVPGNEVRIGGARVGLIDDIEPVGDAADGSLRVRVPLRLDEDIRPLPLDSTVIVRSRSALGLKFLEIDPGTDPQGLEDGETLPVAQARPEPVEIDEVLNIFDAPTRDAIQDNLTEFAAALAGRGVALNRALADLDPAIESLEPVAGALADPDTGLRATIRALGATAAQLAPVAEVQAALFGDLDTTFRAMADVARPYIQEAISESPPTLQEGIRSLPVQRPFLRDSRELVAALRPGVAALRGAAPDLRAALVAGTPSLRRMPAMNRRLIGTFGALTRFSRDPVVTLGLRRLTRGAELLREPLAFVAPAQTVCNYASILLSNASSVVSVGDGIGTWQRFIVMTTPEGPNAESGPSAAPAAGGSVTGRPDNFLHSNPFPNTASPGQPRECEAGNEPYLVGQQVIGNVPGNQGTRTRDQVPVGGR